jgi:8-oxo-dGTP diphosphatase
MHLEPRPFLTVDVVLLTIVSGELQLVLHRRKEPPFAGRVALIGGYVHPQEDATAAGAAERILREKAGIEARILDQLATFSGPARDPRGWSASIAYYALTPEISLKAAEAASLVLAPLAGTAALPFDHADIIGAARQRWRRRAAYSTLPAFLLAPQFTLSELRKVYELVLGRTLNDSAFRRKIDELRLIEPVDGAKSRNSDRPAQLYRLCETGVVEFDRTI